MFQENNSVVGLSKDVSQNMNKAGNTFSCHFLFIYPLFEKRAAALGKNSCKRNYFINGKHGMGNFGTPYLQRFSKMRKFYIHKKTTVVKFLLDK